MEPFAQKLAQHRAAQLIRQRKTTSGPQQPQLTIAGTSYLNFASNNYLDLANHPQIKAALKQGVDHYGVGSGSAYLVTGHSQAHQALEEELAEFTGYDRVLFFSNGYMANLGLLQTFSQASSLVYQDRLNHASLLDGALLAKARIRRYRHNDSQHLEQLLNKHCGVMAQPSQKPHLIVSESLFSMDGDLADLPQLARLARQYASLLIIDDAHGFGVLGRNGKGSVDHYQLNPLQVPLLMATLDKALGVAGAFVAASDTLIDTLTQFARSYIYTTALPPALAQAARASLKLLQTETWRQQRLHYLISYFRQGVQQLGLPLTDSHSPIQPIIIGDTCQLLAIHEKLLAQGILTGAIRPPSVPKATDRLRITLTAGHSEEQLDRLLAALEQILAKQPLTPAHGVETALTQKAEKIID